MRDLLDFKTKKDRDDFLIAITVIGLFFSFFYGMTSCNDKTILPKELSNTIATITPADLDEDGVPDEEDKCPAIAGVLINNGCPADGDGDGVFDVNDKCPTAIGLAKNEGCPIDTDEDGVPDAKDKCPELVGIARNNGCPADGDGDGVFDINDKCPTAIGLAENEGCPEVILEKTERTFLNTAMQNIAFVTGSATLKPTSTAVLNKIADILSKYKKYRLDIDGFTDNTGNPANNLLLSQQRAKSCYDYLVSAGIAKSRMSYKGFGEQKPISSNDTPDGRQQNRRVEFNLHY